MPRNIAYNIGGVRRQLSRPANVADGTWTSDTLFSVTAGTRSVQRPSIIVSPQSNGWRAPTAWAVTEQALSDWEGTIDRTSNGARTRWTGALNGILPALPSTNDLPSLNDKSRAEVAALLKAKQGAYNLSVMFAESFEAVNTVASTALDLFNAYKAVKHGDMVGASKALRTKLKTRGIGKTTSERWLELQYGWLPMLSDVKDVYDDLQTRFQTDGLILGVKATVGLKNEHSFTMLTPSNGSQPYFTTDRGYSTSVSLWYRVRSEALRRAAQVGLINPLEVAWEVTPLSCLVDWFFPIGNWLEALTATAGLSFLGGTCTRRSETVRRGNVYPFAHGTFVPVESEASCLRRSFQMDRTVYSSSPIPLPYYKNPFSTGHALNALALLGSLK